MNKDSFIFWQIVNLIKKYQVKIKTIKTSSQSQEPCQLHVISSENKLNVFYSIILPCPKCRIHMDTVHCNSYNDCERRPILMVKCPAFFHYCPMTVNKEIIIIYIGLLYFKILKEFVFFTLTFLGKILAHSFYTRFLLSLERFSHQSLDMGSVL